MGMQCVCIRSIASTPSRRREFSVWRKIVSRVKFFGQPGLGFKPSLVARKNARGRLRVEETADERLAASHAVDVGGVEEGDAGVGRGGERFEGVAVGDVAPFAPAELPRAEADLRNLRAELAETSPVHGLFSPPIVRAGRGVSTAGRPSDAPRRPEAHAKRKKVHVRSEEMGGRMCALVYPSLMTCTLYRGMRRGNSGEFSGPNMERWLTENKK